MDPVEPTVGRLRGLWQPTNGRLYRLCDQALAVLAQARVPGLDSVFVDDDAALEARYGLRVPVLRDAQGRELDWPFDVAAVEAWIR